MVPIAEVVLGPGTGGQRAIACPVPVPYRIARRGPRRSRARAPRLPLLSEEVRRLAARVVLGRLVPPPDAVVGVRLCSTSHCPARIPVLSYMPRLQRLRFLPVQAESGRSPHGEPTLSQVFVTTVCCWRPARRRRATLHLCFYLSLVLTRLDRVPAHAFVRLIDTSMLEATFSARGSRCSAVRTVDQGGAAGRSPHAEATAAAALSRRPTSASRSG